MLFLFENAHMQQRNVGSLYLVVALGGILSVALWWLLADITRGLHPDLVTSLVNASPESMRGFFAELKYGFEYEEDNNNMPTVAFLVLQVLLWSILVAVFLLLQNQRASPRVTWLIVLFAIGFRILMLGSVPIHENDFYRYLWDGKTLKNGINPYLYEPAALFIYEQGLTKPMQINGVELNGRSWSEEDEVHLQRLLELRGDNHQLHERIGHWQVPTVYPPAAQGFFALSSLCFEDSLLGLKMMLMIFDVACIGLIVALLILLKRSTAAVILYAWSPLILVEFSNSAHYDAIPIFFLLLAICFSIGKNAILGGITSGIGTLTKFFGALIVPILHSPKRWQSWIIYLLCALVVIGSYWPFVVWQDAGIARVFSGLGTYSRDWQNNSFFFLIIDGIMGGETYARAKIVVALVLVAGIVAVAYLPSFTRQDVLEKCFWVVALLFLLNPTSFPWYFAWVVPFLCVFPSPSLILLMLTVSAYYLQFHSDYTWTSTELLGLPALTWITWGPFLVFSLVQGITWLAIGRHRRESTILD
ncbi:MAG: glycosyltransferase 87 family protein [Verrucomicrobiota bacterium]